MTRKQVFLYLDGQLQQLRHQKVKALRIAVTGIQGTGKTTFCQAWARHLCDKGLDARHISIDGFHNQKSIRYRNTSDLAQGYYDDGYNEKAFVEMVLQSSQTDRPVVTEFIYDLATDQIMSPGPVSITPQTIIITDGAFLLKDIYRPHWDFKIYLYTDFATARSRGAHRDAPALGSLQQASDKFRSRYHRAAEIHLAGHDLTALSDMVIDVTDWEHLHIIKGH